MDNDLKIDNIIGYYILTMSKDDITVNFKNKEYLDEIKQKIKNMIIKEVSEEKLKEIYKLKFSNVELTTPDMMYTSLSNFYTKIGHIFAVVISTLNPFYSYLDEKGNYYEVAYKDRYLIPYSTRIYLKTTGKNEIFEKNIEELESLYYDIFDGKKYSKMSNKSKSLYSKHLLMFYRAFTGKMEMPSHIKKFSDIKYSYYNKIVIKKQHNSVNEKNLFKHYGYHLNKMTERSNINKENIMKILNSIFVQKDKNLGINSSLTFEDLTKKSDNLQDLLYNMFKTCESDHLERIKIYQAIIEYRIYRNNKNRINNIKNKIIKIN